MLITKNEITATIGVLKTVSLEQIDDFSAVYSYPHPFKICNDDEMQSFVKSIKENGILSPCIVRLKDNGRYEMVSGHRRKMGCELLQLDKIPCLVKELTDDEGHHFND